MVDAQKMGTEELYSFTYADGLKEGVYITEQLHVDKLSGRFTWSRGFEGHDSALRTGSSYLIPQVSSVRFATRLGDPSSEFLTVAQRAGFRKRTILTWLHSQAPSILAFLVMIFNILTLTVVLSGLLSYAWWQVFPLTEDGQSYDMGRGPDSEVLAAASTLAALTALSALLSGWWLGAFRCRCCGGAGLARDNIGIGTRLSDKVAARYKIQRPITGGTLIVVILWCAFIVILGPVSYGLSFRTECASGGCQLQPNSTLVPTCGVGSCSCGAIADLSCVTAEEGADLSLCRNVKQPMCAVTGSTELTSGIHLPLLVATVGTSAISVFLVLVWLFNVYNMYMAWAKPAADRPVVMVQQVQYHRFSVNFRSRVDGKLTFTLSAEEDPHAVAAALMPRGLGPRPGGLGPEYPMYQAPSTLMGGYVPGGAGLDGANQSTGFNSTGVPATFEADNAELEPQWC
eukprot:gb/GFBE01045044.1/.p1 GENE.gb/GFBE01045044.1/~~gb/GFBE01045044.1/.p1  ORF type:complete len:457 (+),score=78.77 gb/GFBE01045044.1/:1-1371(+)